MTIKNRILSELLIKLKDYKIDYPIALVGSATTKLTFNDLDLLMVVEDIDKVKDMILTCFGEYNIKQVDDAVKITDFSEIEISIALYSKYNVDNMIKDFLSGKENLPTHRTWSIGYWICESFVNNLSQMEIVNDKCDYLKNMQVLTKKVSPYSKRRILSECIEEIDIKRELVKKNDISSLEYKFFKDDLILSMIRGIYTNNNQYINGFKRLTELVNNCPIEYRKELLEFINEDNLYAINNILEKIKSGISWNNRIYLGTWQYGGGFKDLSDEEIEELLKYVKEKGIKKFDTALVYGNGNVERILSKVIDDNDEVLTKIPAKMKPNGDNCSNITDFYSYDYLRDCVNKSLSNLSKRYIDTCLLHNWSIEWNNHFEIIEWLLELKNEKLINRIGISLPNGYNDTLPDEVLYNIDVIEAPYNVENKWIEKDIDKYKEYGIEIILRSLFLQGKVLKEKNESPEEIIKKAMQYDTPLVIGMTTFDQIDENVKILRR